MFQSRNRAILRAIPVFVALCLANVSAAAKYSGGTGEPNDPYQIATAADLIALGNEPNDYSRHFILTADIDLDTNLSGGKVFDKAPIAPDVNDVSSLFEGTPFTGVFDGNGHTISRLTVMGGGCLGLFGQLASGAEVRDLGVVDVDVTGSDRYVGGLAGRCSGAVSGCYCTGTVRGTDSVGGLVGSNEGTIINCQTRSSIWGDHTVGGLVGANGKTVSQCSSTGSVSGQAGSSDLGALAGKNLNGSISNCYAVSTVTCGDDSFNVGGLVGGNYATVTLCWSAGSVSGGKRCLEFGGLVGRAYGGSISNSYSAAHVWGDSKSRFCGGLVGQNNEAPVSHCFWDIEASGVGSSEGGFGRTTRDMKTASTYIGWGGGTWTIAEGRDYPHLAWEGQGGVPIENVPARIYAGDGTELSPFVLADADDLCCLMARAEDWGSRFQLTRDIDMAAVKGYLPIGSFSGALDGRRHRILNLNIAQNSGQLGLMGCLHGGRVWDVGLVNVSVTGTGGNIGGLAGIIGYGGSILRCYSTGSVSAHGEGRLIGGLVGANGGSISQCYSTASVSGGIVAVGGLVGLNGQGSITDCRSAGTVSAGADSSSVGGLVGTNLWGTITKCYSVGEVSGDADAWQIGGFAGGNGSIILRCFWDMETSGRSRSDGGKGQPTAKMRTAATFLNAGWDFVGETANGTEDIWWIDEGNDYPRLWWEADGGTL